jgi:hypothetical protein
LTQGPIIRISPYELHVIDPAFFETIYRQEGRWDKYPWMVDAFTSKGSTICTADHNLHRTRRLPLNPFFAKAKIASRTDVIDNNIDKLCFRLSQYAGTNKVIDIGAAISALTRDVAVEFILGKSYNDLEQEDFGVGMTNVFQANGSIWRITKHLPWLGPTMRAIPIDVMMRISDKDMQGFFKFLKVSTVRFGMLWKFVG